MKNRYNIEFNTFGMLVALGMILFFLAAVIAMLTGNLHVFIDWVKTW